MRTKPFDLLPIFRSKLQAELLAMLFLSAEEPLTRAELRDRARASEPTVRRHLLELEGAGLIRSERVGRTMRYRAAMDSPLFQPLRELLERTIGVKTSLADALRDVSGIESAAIFGSWASGGSLRADSDIDVLVIGDVAVDQMADAAAEVESIAGREINFVTYRRQELERKLAEGSESVAAIFNGPFDPLIGDPRASVRIQVDRAEIEDFCRRWKITRLAFFGSVLRDDFRPDSDVDVLVVWADDAKWGLFDHMHAEEELAGMLGRPVDLVDRRAVEESENWIRRRHILEHAETIYVA